MTKDEAMQKIRKLLAMGTDGRGNLNEAETAMRHAQALMRKFQIDSVDEVLADLKGGKEMAQDSDGPFAYPSKNRPTKVPAWVGIVAVGVGKLLTTKVDIIMDRELGARVRFSGYGPDVQFSRWMYRYLIETIHQMACQTVGSRGEREAFRYGCATTVQGRMYRMVAEQEAADREEQEALQRVAIGTMSSALVLFDAKKAAVEAAFGAQGVTQVKREASDARLMGSMAGNKLNIPTARPLGTDARSTTQIGGV